MTRLVFCLFLALPAQVGLSFNVSTQYVSSKNSTTAALTGGATWTGEWEDVTKYATMSVGVLTDQAGTLFIQYSPDGVNQDSSLTYDVAANINEVHRLTNVRRFMRVKYTNGSSAQSFMRLQTLVGLHPMLTAPQNLTLGQDADAIAARTLPFDIEVGLGLRSGFSLVHKFGRNPDIDTATVPEDLWEAGGTYTGFPTNTPELVECLSDNAADTLGGAGAEKVTIYGLDGTNKLVASETISLSGVTPVDSASTFYRVNRIVVTQSNNGANDAYNVGTITCRQTTTTANVFGTVTPGHNQSEIGAYTVPADKTGCIRGGDVAISRANTATLVGGLWGRVTGTTPQTLNYIFTASNSEAYTRQPYGGICLPALTDFTIQITSVSANNTEVSTNLDIVLIDN